MGAGLIGLEAAENFIHAGLKVTILEALGWPLPALLDPEIAVHVEKHLKAKGVNVIFGQRVTGFQGDSAGQVRQVMVGDTGIDAGLVLLSLGVRPNVTLAKEAGLTIGATGGLAVNEYLQTSDPDIYAGGDCVEVVNLITKKKTLVPMGSTANKHGRIIGTNVTGGRDTFPGVVGTAIVKVFDLNVGTTGLNEAQARGAGYDVVTSLVPTFDHATYYPGARDITGQAGGGKVRRQAARRTGGGTGRNRQAYRCPGYRAHLRRQSRMTLPISTCLTRRPITAPWTRCTTPLTLSATNRPAIAKALTPQEVKSKLDKGEKFVLLDVRSPPEWQAQRIEAPQVKLIPLPELRQRMGELARDEEIVILCRTSIRAYQAQRILDGAGFKNVKFMDGSITAWPYKTTTQK